MRVLRDALVTWRCRAVEAVQDQRILTQTLALESYEQALSEVGDERDVSEAVGRATAVEVIALDAQLERIALPRLRVCWHHVHVRAIPCAK